MTPFLIVVAILVCHSGGNFLHAEKRFVEVGYAEMVVRMNGDMPDFSKHSNHILVARILLKDGRICQQREYSPETPNQKHYVNLTSAKQED